MSGGRWVHLVGALHRLIRRRASQLSCGAFPYCLPCIHAVNVVVLDGRVAARLHSNPVFLGNISDRVVGQSFRLGHWTCHRVVAFNGMALSRSVSLRIKNSASCLYAARSSDQLTRPSPHKSHLAIIWGTFRNKLDTAPGQPLKTV